MHSNTPSTSTHNPLPGVQALLFDVFGTVVDWHGSIVGDLREKSRGTQHEREDWSAFAYEWRQGYIETTKKVSEGGEGPSSIDIMHRELLDEMLRGSWSKLSTHWDDATRRDLVLGWHRLHAWKDTLPGLHALKSKFIIGTLSNGNMKLLIDMAKHANLPWDVVLSSQLFKSYKPNPAIYLSAVETLSLEPHQVVLVASHIHDCLAAKKCGLKAVYISRPTEDRGEEDAVREGVGKVDLVVDDFEHLARVVGAKLEVAPTARL